MLHIASFPRQQQKRLLQQKKLAKSVNIFLVCRKFHDATGSEICLELVWTSLHDIRETPGPKSFLKLTKKKVEEYETSRVSFISLYSRYANIIEIIKLGIPYDGLIGLFWHR